MLPIVTPEEMRAIDAAALKSVSLTTLIERAGAAVMWSALRMLGGTYGRRVVVLAGPGNNGADGRVAARRLAERNVHVTLFDVASRPPMLPECDLVIDAAYGTGFRGLWNPPRLSGSPMVLAVDIPSGVNGLTGEAASGVLAANRTITFAALKPGLLLGAGAIAAGVVEVADIGLSCEAALGHLVEACDVAAWYPVRQATAHKWRAAVRVIAGSIGMTGAAHLASAGAMRAGAGMVHLSVPGAGEVEGAHEYVVRPIPPVSWADDVLRSIDRFQSIVIGPGLGRNEATIAAIRETISSVRLPAVIDGDGLYALAWSKAGAVPVLGARQAATVLTPHDGEFALLTGSAPGADRIQAARRLAQDLKVVVLLKGPATIVAEPSGRVLVSDSGDQRLATAGTGDVLAGIIGALLAQDVSAFEAAAAGAWIHGRAGQLGQARGLVASDLLTLIPQVLRGIPQVLRG